MTSPYLTLTVTQQIRAFLVGQGLSPVPWASVSEVLDGLRALLVTRRSDDTFWCGLSDLLTQVVSDQGSQRLATPEAEILADAEIDALVEEIREALGEGPQRRPTTAFLRRLTGPSLCAFLLLGMAVGCESAPKAPPAEQRQVSASESSDAAQAKDPSTEGEPRVEPEAEPEVADEGGAVEAGPEETTAPGDAVAPPAEEPKTVVDYVNTSDLADETRAALLACLDEKVSDAQRLDLLQLFQTQTPEQIAAALEAYVASETCAPPKAEPKRRRKPRLEPTPLYKGVSFPPEADG